MLELRYFLTVTPVSLLQHAVYVATTAKTKIIFWNVSRLLMEQGEESINPRLHMTLVCHVIDNNYKFAKTVKVK